MKLCFIALHSLVFGKMRELVGETKYAFAWQLSMKCFEVIQCRVIGSTCSVAYHMCKQAFNKSNNNLQQKAWDMLHWLCAFLSIIGHRLLEQSKDNTPNLKI